MTSLLALGTNEPVLTTLGTLLRLALSLVCGVLYLEFAQEICSGRILSRTRSSMRSSVSLRRAPFACPATTGHDSTGRPRRTWHNGPLHREPHCRYIYVCRAGWYLKERGGKRLRVAICCLKKKNYFAKLRRSRHIATVVRALALSIFPSGLAEVNTPGLPRFLSLFIR